MFIDKLIERAKENKKSIVLVECDDIDILNAAYKSTEFANIILVGKKENVAKLVNNDINLDRFIIIDPNTSEITNELINKFYEIRKDKGLTLDEARNIILNDYLYFGAMLVYTGYADGMVAGKTHSSRDVIRSALKTVRYLDNTKFVSSFFIMELENKNIGSNGLLLFSDCGMIENPTSDELANIAYESSKSFERLIKETPKIAFLSYSTNGSASSDSVNKVKNAVNIFNNKCPNILADGEMQLDSAIIPDISKIKFPDSKIKGDANILIFPDLNSGNIAYKITERLANAKAYGPITQGLKKPINDLSRGSTVDDIVGVIAITCIQAK